MKHLFVINPAAGKGKALELIPEIQKIFSGREDEYLIEVTQGPKHATEIVKEYVKRDQYRVYSVGGDGTLNEVLNGLVESQSQISASSLAVIPAGSGNDFIKNISTDLPALELLRKTIDSPAEPIDIVKVNGKYFVNISSMGLDAEVAANAAWLKKVPLVTGGLSYLISIFITILGYRNQFLTISIDGHEMKLKSLLIAVANGKYYGGGFQPTPEACINDGFFNICLIGRKNIFEILRFFPKYKKGEHGTITDVHFFKARKAKINCNREIAINIDGEVIKVKEALFEVIPQGVNMVIP